MARPPAVRAGMRIGLFGGSFDPPHEGHRAASLLALRRLRLNAVWWLVTPGNPLKGQPATPLAERLASAQALARHTRIRATGFEAALGATRSVDTLRWLRRRFASVRFVWVMGADNLATFHLWRNWREIAALVPIAVIDRPGYTRAALASPAARFLRQRRLPQRAARNAPGSRPPALVFLTGPRVALSSTLLRKGGQRLSS